MSSSWTRVIMFASIHVLVVVVSADPFSAFVALKSVVNNAVCACYSSESYQSFSGVSACQCINACQRQSRWTTPPCVGVNYQQTYNSCQLYVDAPSAYITRQGCAYYKIGTTAISVQTLDGVNVAPGHTTVQMSIYPPHAASLAVDGNYTTASCTLMTYLKPWWAVDLRVQANVARVNVTNDINTNFGVPQGTVPVCHSTSMRLNNFIVGLSNAQPNAGQPMTSSNYTLCHQYNGSVPVSGSAQVTCPPSLPAFRYVIVQSSLTTANAICLAEVEVYLG